MEHTHNLAIRIPPSLMAIFFCLLSFNLHAYSFTNDFKQGFYWRSFPIKMAKFAALSSDSEMLERLTNEAVAEWEAAIGKDIWDFSPVENTSNYTGNFIRWSDNFGAETGYDPVRTLAITIRYNQGTFFEKTVILLNGGIATLRQNWGNTLKATLIHEIGHTLGLDHSGAQAIMAASISSITTLQPDDIAGVNALVDETLNRQATGYISPLAPKEEKVAACGTVEDLSKKGGMGGGSGAANFLGSLLAGFLVIAISKLKMGVKQFGQV